MFCNKCGNPLTGAAFCNKCGAEMKHGEKQGFLLRTYTVPIKKFWFQLKKRMPPLPQVNAPRRTLYTAGGVILGILLIILLVTVVQFTVRGFTAGNAVAQMNLGDMPTRSTLLLEETHEGFVLRDVLRSAVYFNYDPRTDVIFPGAVVQGDSLFSEQYQLITDRRAPVSLSLGGNNERVSDPTLTNITAARNRLVDRLPATPTQGVQFFMHSVTQGQAFYHGFNAGVGFKGLGITGGTGQTTRDFTTNMVVIFVETFYTLHVDETNGFFTRTLATQTLGNYAPAYIASVSYGRMGIMTLSSMHREHEVRHALNISIPIKKTTGNFGFDRRVTNVMDELIMQVEIIGGGAGAIRGPGDVAGFFAYFGAPPGDIRNAVPLSYTLRYVYDSSPVPVATIVNEQIIPDSAQLIEIEFVYLWLRDIQIFINVDLDFLFADVIPLHIEPIRGERSRLDNNRNVFLVKNKHPVLAELRIDVYQTLRENDDVWNLFNDHRLTFYGPISDLVTHTDIISRRDSRVIFNIWPMFSICIDLGYNITISNLRNIYTF